jgi:hypothetical protein
MTWPFERCSFESELTPSDCAELVHRNTTPDTFRPFWRRPPVGSIEGRCEGQLIELYTSTRFKGLEPYFSGTIHPIPTGSLIRGRFIIHPFALIGWFGYFGTMLIGTVGGFAICLVAADPDPFFFLSAAGLLVAGVAFLAFAWQASSGQRRAVLEFLESRLEARRLTTS